jgi:hypothetical protein
VHQRSSCSEFPNDNPALHDGAIWVCEGTCDAPVAEKQVMIAIAKSDDFDDDAATFASVDLEVLAMVDSLVKDPQATVEALALDLDDEGDGSDIIVEELEDISFEDAPEPLRDSVFPIALENAPRVSEIVLVSHAKKSDEDDAVSNARADATDPFAYLLRMLSEVALIVGGSAEATLVGAILGESRIDARSLSEAQINALVGGGIIERTATGITRDATFTAIVIAWQSLLRGECDDMSGCGPKMLDEWAADIVARALGAPAKSEQLRRELRNRGVAAFGLIEVAA